MNDDSINYEIGAIKDEVLYELADLFKVFSDSTRIRILHSLYEHPLHVNQLAKKLNMDQSAVSHQLRVLKQACLVKYHKDGKKTIYSLDDEHVYKIFEQGLSHISHR